MNQSTPLPPSGYNWCTACEMHWALTILSKLCPVCAPDRVYGSRTKPSQTPEQLRINSNI